MSKLFFFWLLLHAAYGAGAQKDSVLILNDQEDADERSYYAAIEAAALRPIDTAFNEAFRNHVHRLDRAHPSGYFMELGRYLERKDYAKVAFLYYLGKLRYRYYNSANPKYRVSDDGALLASLSAIAAEPVDLYLKGNVENYLKLLRCALNWYNRYDYRFYPRSKAPKKYGTQAAQLEAVLTDVGQHKEAYRRQWREAIDAYKKAPAGEGQ